MSQNYIRIALTVLFLGPIFLISGLGAKVAEVNKPDGLNILVGMVGTSAQIAVIYWLAHLH
jgi:hypothetical protein